MESIFSAVLFLHIASGFFALATGTLVMVLPKGNQKHKSLGKIFFGAMAGVFASSLYLSIAKGNWFLLCIGVFSFYLTASAFRILSFKSAKAFQKGPALYDYVLGIGGLAAGLGLLVLGLILFSKGIGFGIVPIIFGSISAFMAYRSLGQFKNPPARKDFWVRAHAARMGGAYTATVTAFLVVNIQVDMQWILWLLPGAIVSPVIVFQIRRFLTPKRVSPVIASVFIAGFFSIVFKANAQPNLAAISVQDYGEGLLAKVITEFPEGAFELKTRILPGMQKPLMYTENTTRTGTKVEGSIILLGSVPFTFKGYASPDSLMIALYKKGNENPVGKMEAGLAERKMADVGQVCREISDTILTYIYSKAELKTKGYLEFAGKIDFYSQFLQDEWELFAAINRDMRSLPFSHTRFTKMPKRTFIQMVNNQFKAPNTNADLQYPNEKTAILTIRQFNGDGSNLSGFMKEIITKKADNLVIDLRGNSGGGAGPALQLVKHLAPVYHTSGALVTNKWFDTTSRLPTPADYPSFYHFTNGPTFELIEALNKNAGLILSVTPAPEQFTGKVYVLTSRRTASACEPTVYALQHSGRAMVVGENTAGQMLSSGAYYLNSGFVLTLPVADYYTADGVRLEGNGVKPDVKVPADKALEKVLEILKP